MKTFVVPTENGKCVFNLPTSIEEITSSYIKNVTNNVKVAPHHTLVGIVYVEKISNLVMLASSKKRNMTSSVTPIFIKSGNIDESNKEFDDFIKGASLKDTLLISNSDLSLAYHVATPNNVLGLDKIVSTIMKSTNRNLYQETLNDPVKVMFIEFKIVPNVNIKAVYKSANKIEQDYYNEIPNTVNLAQA